MMLSEVCLSVAYVGSKSRTERSRKTKIGTEVAHVTRDSDTTFKVKRSKVKVTRSLCSSNYIIYMDDTIFHATLQSEPLPIDHEYSWRKARWRRRRKAYMGWSWAAACGVQGLGAYCVASRTACLN